MPAPSFGGAAATSDGEKVDCPKCGTSNNKSFKFCGTCGHPLGEQAAGAPAPAPAPAPVPAATGGSSVNGTLVLIRPDGTEGESIAFDQSTIVGREAMPQFSGDQYLSPQHARFSFDGTGLTVHDNTSLNGIYLRIDREVPVELEDGSIFRIGQEIVRYEALPDAEADGDGVTAMGSPRSGLIGRICLITGRESVGNCYSVPADGLHLGRERGDILFPDDGYVSGLHARVHGESGSVYLTDVGSSNGTFIRIEDSSPVPNGAMLLMGQQLFRVEF